MMKTIQSLLILLLISLGCGAIISILVMFLAGQIYDIPFLELATIFDALEEKRNLNAARLIQIGNTLGLFILPAIVFAKIKVKEEHFLQLNQSVNFKHLLFLPLLYFVAAPFLNWTIELNQALSLPEAFSSLETWMRNAEKSAEYLTKSFLSIDSFGEFLYMTFLIAILPALGEELIFRGIIQKIINQSVYNHHIGIWVSAALFSAIHMQFFGFLPRMLLGAYFGYLFYWSKNLWFPILAHFINNFSALLMHYILEDNFSENIDQLGTGSKQWWLSALSLVLFTVLLIQFKKAQKKSPAIDEGY